MLKIRCNEKGSCIKKIAEDIWVVQLVENLYYGPDLRCFTKPEIFDDSHERNYRKHTLFTLNEALEKHMSSGCIYNYRNCVSDALSALRDNA